MFSSLLRLMWAPAFEGPLPACCGGAENCLDGQILKMKLKDTCGFSVSLWAVHARKAGKVHVISGGDLCTKTPLIVSSAPRPHSARLSSTHRKNRVDLALYLFQPRGKAGGIADLLDRIPPLDVHTNLSVIELLDACILHGDSRPEPTRKCARRAPPFPSGSEPFFAPTEIGKFSPRRGGGVAAEDGFCMGD